LANRQPKQFSTCKSSRYSDLQRGDLSQETKRCFAVNPERPEGVRGQNKISLSSRWPMETGIAKA
jgi:hypothetical protein